MRILVIFSTISMASHAAYYFTKNQGWGLAGFMVADSYIIQPENEGVPVYNLNMLETSFSSGTPENSLPSRYCGIKQLHVERLSQAEDKRSIAGRFVFSHLFALSNIQTTENFSVAGVV